MRRIEYLDYIKAVSIILVVFCHNVALSEDSILGNIMMAIAWAAVPNFFFVTGGLMHQSRNLNWRKHIYKIVHAYVILCVWKAIYLVFFSLIRDITFSKVDLIKYLFFFGDIPDVETSIMWFMYAYLSVLLFFPISYFLFRNGKEGKRILGFLVIILFIQGFFVPAVNYFFEIISMQTGRNLLQISISESVPFGGWPNMLFFYIIGAFLFQWRDRINWYLTEKVWRKYIPVILFVAGVGGLIFAKYCKTGLISWGNCYIESGYNKISTILLALGFYLILQNQRIGKARHFLAKYIGTITMGIYFIHRPILAWFKDLFGSYYEAYGSFGLNVLKTAVAMVICVLITMGMKKIPLVKELVK